MLFCLLIVFATLTPLSNYGSASNEFGSVGMWLALIMLAVMYLIPLVIYIAGVRFFKYVLAFLCGLGIMIHSATIAAFLISDLLLNSSTPATTTVLIISVLFIVVNIIWFFITFRTEKRQVVT